MVNEYIHYRLPLRLINSYTWANLIPPARAILPVIGIHCSNKNNKAWPGIKLISKLSGYKNLVYVRAGIDDLIKNNLMIREKEGRRNNYFLINNAIRKTGSYFPVFKDMLLRGCWSGLTPGERSLYIVLGVKAVINDPEVLDSYFYAIGDIYKVKKFIKWSGICRQSFYNSYRGLYEKGFIYFKEEDYYKYGIYVRPLK
ncbi:hypothetical protein ES705_41063 [subsurface metagenome]